MVAVLVLALVARSRELNKTSGQGSSIFAFSSSLTALRWF